MSHPHPSGKLSSAESTDLAMHVAGLAEAGLPLDTGLRALADELRGGRLAGVLRAMAKQLEAGATLDDAIAAQGDRLPAHLRGLVTAGVRSGRLAQVLSEFVEARRIAADLRRRALLSLAYPTFLMVLVALLMVFFQEFIAYDFKNIFRDFGMRLPRMTEFLIYVSPHLERLLVAAAVLLGAALVASRLVPVAAWISAVVAKIPVIGPMLRWAGWAQFSRLMGLLVEQGVPLPVALRLTAAGVHDAAIAAGCRRAAAAVENGASLHETFASHRPFPPSLVPLVQWGERSQTLADAFRAASDVFEGRARAQSVLVEVILPPLAFLTITIFLGFAIIALFMPVVPLILFLSR